jgi:hypothetical protein
MPELEDPIDPPAPPDEGAVVLCPHCLARNTEDRHFCVQCATPLTAHAAIDPLGRIYATGDTYRKAIASPRKPIVVIGMWLLFGPAALALLLLAASIAITMIEHPGTFDGPMDFFMPLGGLSIFILEGVVSAMILVRLTRSVRARKKKQNPPPPPRGFSVVLPKGQEEPAPEAPTAPDEEDDELEEQDASAVEAPHVAALLIPESMLIAKDTEVRRRIAEAQQTYTADPNDESYGAFFRHYLLFTHWPDLLNDSGIELSDLAIFCNRYYWFLRFSKAYEAVHGKDEAIQQEGFEILEETDVEMEWMVIEQIKECVEYDSRLP